MKGDCTKETASNKLKLDAEHDVAKNNKPNVNDINMIVENEESQQPDISEIIRSLDTPPPS